MYDFDPDHDPWGHEPTVNYKLEFTLLVDLTLRQSVSHKYIFLKSESKND